MRSATQATKSVTKCFDEIHSCVIEINRCVTCSKQLCFFLKNKQTKKNAIHREKEWWML